MFIQGQMEKDIVGSNHLSYLLCFPLLRTKFSKNSLFFQNLDMCNIITNIRVYGIILIFISVSF